MQRAGLSLHWEVFLLIYLQLIQYSNSLISWKLWRWGCFFFLMPVPPTCMSYLLIIITSSFRSTIIPGGRITLPLSKRTKTPRLSAVLATLHPSLKAKRTQNDTTYYEKTITAVSEQASKTTEETIHLSCKVSKDESEQEQVEANI